MKLRYFVPALIFVALIATFAYMLQRKKDGYDPSVLTSALLGKKIPSFSVPQVEKPDSYVSDEDFLGRIYVLNVWATWCVECRHEHPLLLEIAKQGMVPIVGLDTKDDLAGAQRWLNTLGNPYSATGFDADGRVALNLGVYGAPETFLIDAQGVLIYKRVGVLTPEVWQREFVPRIESAKRAAAESGDRS